MAIIFNQRGQPIDSDNPFPVALYDEAGNPVTAIGLAAGATVSVAGSNGEAVTADSPLPVASIALDYAARLLAISPDNLVGYWPLNEPAGVTAVKDFSPRRLNLTYSATGTTPSTAAGIGDVRRAVTFDGTDSHVNLYPIEPHFNPNKGSFIGWAKVDAGTRWEAADAASTSRWVFHPRGLDANYYFAFGRGPTAQTIEYRRRTGGAITTLLQPLGTGPTDWFMIGATWDVTGAAPLFKAYFNGAMVDFSESSSMTEWDLTAKPLGAGSTVLYAGSTTLQEWIGNGAHCALWADYCLTDAEMAALGAV